MLSTVTHIQPLAVIRRERQLPIDGKVLVRTGKMVRAGETIAVGNLSPKHYTLDVANGLGISDRAVANYLQREVNEDIVQGDIIAQKEGFFKRVVRSPVKGRIVLVMGGLLLIEVESKPTELKAGLPGEVVELIPDRGVVIETSGALIQGFWGNGRIDSGLLTVLSDHPEHELTENQIDVSMRGAVILSGYCAEPEALRTAAEHRIRGLILSSIPSALIHTANRMPYPVMVTDGFGKQPMNEAAYRLLSTNKQREVAVNAEPLDRATGARPEVIIPIEGANQFDTLTDIDHLANGQRVRITRAPYQGAVGRITALLPGLTNLPNGLRVPAANVQVNDTETAIPLVNLEILN
jgi:hypothetical protein